MGEMSRTAFGVPAYTEQIHQIFWFVDFKEIHIYGKN